MYDNWTEIINNNEYIMYFISNENKWLNFLKNLKKYIDENGKTPSCHIFN